ncbi:hypothetical protein Pmani_000630 [Petrolisthes manimaculis]|uniref:Uncharacterized protein n=1 Tax=Petrolisthes manimaculis TaxID=1843537 RepID=A0AAE1QMF5_9EUCA|nr:hypothetical protein Pmani_000630 [Petrolisthes manimaculis]
MYGTGCGPPSPDIKPDEPEPDPNNKDTDNCPKDGKPNRTFYSKKAPPTPKGVKGFVIRDEPQFDSEVSDISVDDSDDEYYLSQDDSAMLRQDSMLVYQDEDRIIMGRSRRRTLLPELPARGILCMGTVRSNRLAGLKLIPDKDLKSKGKSTFVEYEGKISPCAGSIKEVVS